MPHDLEGIEEIAGDPFWDGPLRLKSGEGTDGSREVGE